MRLIKPGGTCSFNKRGSLHQTTIEDMVVLLVVILGMAIQKPDNGF
jgi:hypothetical protein